MSSEFGTILRVGVFGESHGRAIGVTVQGLPAGEAVDQAALEAFLDRRRPGRNALSTARNEPDRPVFLSGLYEGKTTGSPLTAIIENLDARSRDYSELADKPRPGHADYTAFVKWGGAADMRGGGHFSGRLTAPLCVAGGIARQILARRGVIVGAHLHSVAGIADKPLPMLPDRALLESFGEREFPVLDEGQGKCMQDAILSASHAGDSVGGVIECAAIGLPAGLGGPMFDGVESGLSHALFGIPAIKGVEFGAGFAAAAMRGSEHNDPFRMGEQGEITTETNHAGGILGGITTGRPLVFRVAVKPTPSIAKQQRTVSLARRENTELVVHGRHDPCVAHRAVPVVEAVTALVLLDFMLEENRAFFGAPAR
ncbi:Chorismate synthase [bioreactor metagenome]|uniref:chorismate synthase n=1 Tax=bioreactor metagenome TaxID=1076179 RepID=A0A645CQ99_9ZZZZ|nr:chorismate synthase [Christensenella sp.]